MIYSLLRFAKVTDDCDGYDCHVSSGGASFSYRFAIRNLNFTERDDVIMIQFVGRPKGERKDINLGNVGLRLVLHVINTVFEQQVSLMAADSGTA